jgi:hypothetical protein
MDAERIGHGMDQLPSRKKAHGAVSGVSPGKDNKGRSALEALSTSRHHDNSVIDLTAQIIDFS